METERNPFNFPLVLRTIFAHSSFSSLLQFRLVNSAWNFDATFVARKISSGKDSSVSPISFRFHYDSRRPFYLQRFDKHVKYKSEENRTRKRRLEEFNDCIKNSSDSFSFPSTRFQFLTLDFKLQDLADFIQVFGAQVRKLEMGAGDFRTPCQQSSFTSEEDFVECLARDFPNLKHLILGSFAYGCYQSSYMKRAEKQKMENAVKFSHPNLSTIEFNLNSVDALSIEGYQWLVNVKKIQTLLNAAVNLEEFINFEVELLPAFTTGTLQNIQRKLDTIKEFRMLKFQLMEMDDLQSQREISAFLKQLQEFAKTAPSLKKLSICCVQKRRFNQDHDHSDYGENDDYENYPNENAENGLIQNADEDENVLSFDESSAAKFEISLSLLLKSSANSLEEISLHPTLFRRPLHQIFPANPLKNVKTVKIYDFFQWFHLTGKTSSNLNEDQKQGFLFGPDFGHFLSPVFPNIQKFVIDLGNQTRSLETFQFQLMDLKFSLPRSIRHLEIVSKRFGGGIGRFLHEIQDAILIQNSDSDFSEIAELQIQRLTLKFSLYEADFTEILQSIFAAAAWRNLTNLELGIVEDFHGMRYSYLDLEEDQYDYPEEVDLNAALGGIQPRPTNSRHSEEFCWRWSLCGISDENEFQSQVEKLKRKKLARSIDQLSKLRWLSIDLGNDCTKIVKLDFVGIFLACESLPNLSIKVNVAPKNLDKMREDIFGQVQSARFNSRVFVTSGEGMEGLERNIRKCQNDRHFYYY